MQPQIKSIKFPESPYLANIRSMIQACIQCGTCTGSCPNEFAMDFTPRKLWRMVAMGQEKTIFRSQTFALCSACYTCSLRCPRGLPLTAAMALLKQAAARRNEPSFRKSAFFYQSFIHSIRKHGRVHEMAFMTNYFTKRKNPLLPLRFAPLGIKLISKGKLGFQFHSRRKLEALFKRVEELEKKDKWPISKYI